MDKLRLFNNLTLQTRYGYQKATYEYLIEHNKQLECLRSNDYVSILSTAFEKKGSITQASTRRLYVKVVSWESATKSFWGAISGGNVIVLLSNGQEAPLFQPKELHEGHLALSTEIMAALNQRPILKTYQIDPDDSFPGFTISVYHEKDRNQLLEDMRSDEQSIKDIEAQKKAAAEYLKNLDMDAIRAQAEELARRKAEEEKKRQNEIDSFFDHQ